MTQTATLPSRTPAALPPALEVRSDEMLMSAIARGSEAAFTALVERHSSRVLNFVYRHLGDRQRAEDIAQETFLRVHLNRHRFRPGGNVVAWILTIASNLSKNELRDRSRRVSWWIPFEEVDQGSSRSDPALIDPGMLPDQCTAHMELRRTLLAALLRLPETCRRALELRDIEGLTYEEVARVLRIPGGTVRSRIHRARLLMRGFLERMLPREFLETRGGLGQGASSGAA